MNKDKVTKLLREAGCTGFATRVIRINDPYSPEGVEVTFPKTARWVFCDEYILEYRYGINKYVKEAKWNFKENFNHQALVDFISDKVKKKAEDKPTLIPPLNMGPSKPPKVSVEHGDTAKEYYALINKTIDRVGLVCLCTLHPNGMVEDLDEITINKPTDDVWFRLEINTVANEVRRIIYDGNGNYYVVTNSSKYIFDHTETVVPLMKGVDRFIIDSLIKEYIDRG